MSGAAMLALVPDAFGGRGGIAQYNRDLISALAPGLGAIEVLPRDAPDPAGPLPAKVRQARPLKGRVAYSLRALARAAAGRPDIVFCGHLHMVALAALAARLAGARLVVQLHGVEAWTRPGRWKRRALEGADLVLCVSRYTRGMTLGWADIAPEKVAVLPNTIADGYRPGDREGARRKLGLQAEKTLLSVGRLSAAERYKGHDRIIALLPELGPEVVYLVAGDGDDLERLRALAAECGVAGQVRFLGHAPREALADLYAAADLFVLPSTGEGFGIVFLEAMACGTPALGLDAGGAPDALGDGDLGEAASEAGLPAALKRRLAAPPPDRRALSAAVAARFGRPVFAERAAALFAGLAPPT